MLAPLMLAAAPPPPIECQMVQALFDQEVTMAGRLPARVGLPPIARPSAPEITAMLIPRLAADLSVPDALAKQLTSQVLTTPIRSWKPNCAWSAPNTGMNHAFSRPVVTRDRRLAVFEWITGIQDPPSNLGRVCLAYKPAKIWTLSCTTSWER